MEDRDSSSGRVPRRVLVSGSTGLLGRNVVAALRAGGDQVVPLVRDARPGDVVRWSPGSGTLEPAQVSGFDAVIHLAGEPVAGRWTKAKKQRIFESRVAGTTELVSALRRAERPPAVFLCASGINYYGDCRDEIVTEGSPRGSGFLADVCEAWEAATEPLNDSSRVLTLRIGMVLAREGGALAAMLPIFRLGLGGPVGGGRGYLSWIGLEDLVRAVQHLIGAETLRGPVNAVAPQPVTGREFTRALAAAVGRPAVIPVPAWMARLILGEMAEETVLGSVRALPGRLLEDGFVFRDAALPEALAACHLRQ